MQGLGKRKVATMTTNEENAKDQNARMERAAKDELDAARGNRLELRNETAKRKESYRRLKSEVAEFLAETGQEPTNIAKDRDAAKNAVNEIKAELKEAEEKYSAAVENYKKTRENNGAEDLDIQVEKERRQDDIEIAEGNLAGLKEFLAETRTVHSNLTTRYNTEKTSQLKTELKIQKKRFEATIEDIGKARNEIKELKMQQNDGELPNASDDEDSDEDLDDEELFVSEDEGYISNGDDDEIDPEDIWSPALARKRAGLGKDKFRIEGYRGGRPAKVITARGPPNASSFRLENESDYAVDRKMDKNITEDRIGENKIDGKYQYGKKNMPVIQGIALPPGGSVESVKPIPKVPYGTFQPRAVPTAIKVKWWLGKNQYVKCWETRSTIRRVFGRVQGDLAIYEAAKFQEKRYAEWLTGHRGDTGRSPSAQPITSQVSDGDNEDKPQEVDKTKVKTEPGEEESAETTGKPAEKVPTAMDIFEARWCKRKDIDPAHMTEADELQFAEDWEKVLRTRRA